MIQRLSGDPSYRLSAIFPSDHDLYELAAGDNGLAFSEKTLELGMIVLENTLVVDWHFVRCGNVRGNGTFLSGKLERPYSPFQTGASA